MQLIEETRSLESNSKDMRINYMSDKGLDYSVEFKTRQQVGKIMKATGLSSWLSVSESSMYLFQMSGYYKIQTFFIYIF